MNRPDYQVLLLGCSLSKANAPCIAVDMYKGTLFLKGLEYAKREGLWVMVLSAKYGLINWDTWIEPYDTKMTDCGPYHGPWPQMKGYTLGGLGYFRFIPDHLKPLIPQTRLGPMLSNMNRLLAGTPREELFK